METKLVKVGTPQINHEKLYQNEYLISLLNEAQDAGILSESEAEEIQLQIMDILQWMITRYNGADTSSIRVEIAERLLLSVLYCIDVFCLNIDSPEECLELLRSADMKEIYKEGQQLAKKFLEEAYELFAAVRSSRLNTSVVAYNSTIDEAMPEFFASYDVIFSTHDNMTGIDYPLACDDSCAPGILYIRQYLIKLNMENQFCQLFAEDDIKDLLENYGIIYRIDYPEYLFNIFEIVLTNSIAAVMLGNDAKTLHITEADFTRLHGNLTRSVSSDVSGIYKRAVARMIEELEIEDYQMRDYITKCSGELHSRLLAAVKRNTLQSFVITDSFVDNAAVIRFEHGQTMDDEDFRQMVDQILNSSNAAEKAGIILSGIHSMTDFIDVLKADCLFNGDYAALFGLLGDMELSMLTKYVFAEELRDGKTALLDIISNAPLLELDWANHFMEFLRCIDKSGLRRIEELTQQVVE